MAMSRKHYRQAADAIKGVGERFKGNAEASEAIAQTAQALGRMFKQDNYNFRYDLFFEACGLDAFGEVVGAKE